MIVQNHSKFGPRLTIRKPNYSKNGPQNVQNSIVYGISMSGIQIYLSLFTFLQYDDDERHSTSRSRSASQMDNRDEETSQLDNPEEETSQQDNPEDDEDENSQFEGSQEDENDEDEEMADSKMVDVSYNQRQTWASPGS